MRPILVTLGILAVGILSISTVVRSQAPQSVWEYASVTRTVIDGPEGRGLDAAAICYAIPQGCRYENITATQSNAMLRIHEIYMAATARLGAQGWELTTATDTMENHFDARILYFRRVRK